VLTDEHAAAHILVVEDDSALREVVAGALGSAGYTTSIATHGITASQMLRDADDIDIVLLDIGLPFVDGWQILEQMEDRRGPAVIVISARGEETDKVRALDLGADDYLAKPFEMTELEARIRAHLRRANFHQPTVVECGALVFDSNGRQFMLSGEPLALTAREHAVLEALILRAGSTVSKASLTTTVFGFDDEANPNAIEIYVHRVRKKLVGSDISIVTLRGLGYVLKAVNAD
jgi:two-component system, OmpR family, response regulator TctD